MMEQKQKTAEKQAEELIKELVQEITELKRRDAELEMLSHTEDHLHFLQVSVPCSVIALRVHYSHQTTCLGISFLLKYCRLAHL